MKTKLLIAFLLISNIAFSQTDKTYKHTFSVNVNYLLDQWISKPTQQSIFDIQSDHNILVMYKYRGFRIGAGGALMKEDRADSFLIGTLWNQSHRAYTLLLGTQGTKTVWGKWDFIYGGDVLLEQRTFRSELDPLNNNFTTTTATPQLVWSEITKNTVQLSGFMGFQFHITQQLSCSTEFSLKMNKIFTDDESENSGFFNNPIFSQVAAEDQVNNINFAAPFILFLNFRF